MTIEIQRVGVVGAGAMGGGIAEVSAVRGAEVVVVEVVPVALVAGRTRVEASLGKALERGKITADQHEAALGRLRFSESFEDLGDCQLVIEAVTEREDVKVGVFETLDKVVPPDGLLASNTSSIPITRLAVTTKRPAEVVGLHFFNPATVMPLVEVVSTLFTDDDTRDAATTFVTDVLGKSVVQSKDRAGFVVNAMLVPYMLSAVRMLESGFATAEDIDTGMVKGCGHPMGPLTLGDMVGLDILYGAAVSMFQEFKEPHYAPPPLLSRMIEAGHLGRKSGRGFYDYSGAHLARVTGYRPPLADITLALAVTGRGAWFDAVGKATPDADGVRALLEELGRLAAEVIAPSDVVGDREGPTFDPVAATVTTPPEIRDAYQRYVAGGWGAMTHPEEIGGGGMPELIGLAAEELLSSANLALSLNPMLTHGAVELLARWGDDEQRATWLPRLVTGEWAGTMNLTEPEAGSDLGAVRTRAERGPDGGWRVTGTKIFITWGEHDLTSNIVHLVLARTPEAAAGTAGISLFVVPKVLDGPDGPVRNGVRCIGLEHKLGIHASPTCVMEYDGAVGELVGAEGQGLAAMFTMMNAARLGVGLQGLSVSVRAYQQALAYARERRQGRAPGAAPGVASPIIEHPDVRRMLLAMASSIDAMRLLLFTTAAATDVAEHHGDADVRAVAAARVGLLTPIAKAWCTDEGVRLTSLAVQVHGGMGYVEETGIAERYRDSRIAPIYEGTNGIQAIDLVQRKVARDGGAAMARELDDLDARVAALPPGLADVGAALTSGVAALRRATAWVVATGSTEAGRADVLAGATPYLQLAGVVLAGGLLADQAAHASLGGHPADVAAAKASLARFFAVEQVAPVVGLADVVVAGGGRLDAAEVLAG